MNHDSAVELFSRRALLADEGQWGLFEIASIGVSDEGLQTVEVLWPEETHSSRDVSADDVIAFVSNDEMDWVQQSVGAAFSLYAGNPTAQAWDTFRVTVRLLV
jgi:hypothetical protein